MLRIERQWARRTPLTLALAPLSIVFCIAVAARRSLYRVGVLKQARLAVPVIVAGNICVGGTGKTPVVLWLAEFLARNGFRPGIITRGYGGDGTLRAVTPDSLPSQVGDEPLLLARRAPAPVFCGPSRVHTAQALLATHPQCDVLISDDGLQHYALARDIEIAVVDGARGFGNGLPLPAGPLREPISRLNSVDAIVCNGPTSTLQFPHYKMVLAGEQCVNLLNPWQNCPVSQFKDAAVRAVAATGNPSRFFAQLREHGLTITEHPYPDHHPFRPQDLAFAGEDMVLMTEKDAVKCAAFAKRNWWYLPVTAQIEAALGELILAKVRALNGR
ncbi:MAG: tetraacyldisaccharide 4'-kinase [Betaproteobacteria bacterium]|nr:tetraacyldisaccharide 4'-kinase [Betaproteobacteria bacterium]